MKYAAFHQYTADLALTATHRPAHRAYLTKLIENDQAVAAGPFLDEAGDPNGTMVIVEAVDMAAAKAIATNDPYTVAGLFSTTEIKPWRWTLKNPEVA